MPLRAWLWPLSPTSLYAAPGLVAYVSPWTGEECDVGVGPTYRSALRPLGDLGIDWRRFDG
ncbi:hypothetical protein [Planomonospora algeriensis]